VIAADLGLLGQLGGGHFLLSVEVILWFDVERDRWHSAEVDLFSIEHALPNIEPAIRHS
jgi:hypothetical protein